MKRARFVVALAGLAVAAPMSLAIPVPSGQEADASDTRFDAVVAVGRKHRLTGPDAYDWFTSGGVFNPLLSGGNTGSGVLVAPDLVITARHLWTSDPSVNIDDLICAPSDTTCPDHRRWVIRFRRNPDGTVGTMNEFPLSPALVRGPESFFHVNVTGAIEFPPGDSVLLVLETPVTHIDPMPLTATDARTTFTLGFNHPGLRIHGSVSTIVTPPDVLLPAWFAGWGSSTAPQNAQGSGQFRFRAGSFMNREATVIGVSDDGYQPVALHDSGTPFIAVTGTGTLVATSTIASTQWDNTNQVWGASGPTVEKWLRHPALAGVVGPLSPFDVSGSAEPSSPNYGEWDGRVDLTDVLYAAARIMQGDPDFDLTSTSNPSLPGYGVPDSAVNSDDLLYFLQELVASDNAANGWPTLPLPIRDADNDGDARFTANDFTASGLTQAQIDKYDFDGDGVLGTGDLVIAHHIHDLFGHGIFGDVNSDGVLDEDDVKDIRDLLQNGDPWDSVTSASPGYIVELDDNLDGHLTAYDRRSVAYLLLPRDIGAPQAVLGDLPGADLQANLPDFEVSRIERMAVFVELLKRMPGHPGFTIPYMEATGSGDPADPEWGRPDTQTTGADFKFFLWRHYEVFGPGGYMNDPHASVRMLPIFDANGDGRFNYEDFEYLQTLDPLSAEADDWDLNNDGVFTIYDVLNPGPSDTQVVFDTLFIYGWNQGVVGDFDRSTQPDCCSTYSFCVPLNCIPALDLAADCADYDAMFVAINCLSDSLFDGRTFFSDTDQGYRFELDADLDGDNDIDDRNWIAIQTLGIADINFDGAADSADATLFAALVSAGDPVADIAAPFGVVDFYDLMAFITRMNAGVCGVTSIPFDCP